MFNQLLKYLFIFVIFSYEQTAFPDVNNTFPIPLPSTDYGSADSFKMDNSGGYSGSDYYDSPKKPPYGRSDPAELYNSFWLVPVLSYLMTINGDSVQLQQNPITSLVPVVLTTASHWWFHEHQVVDLMHDRDVKVVGDPVFIAEMTDGGGGDKTSKTSSSTSKKSQHGSSQQRTPSNPSASGSSSKSNGQDDDEDNDNPVHLCDESVCPACNNEPCRCPNCLVVKKPTKKGRRAEPNVGSTSIGNKRKKEDTPLRRSKRLRAMEAHETTSVVRRTTPLSIITNMAPSLLKGEVTSSVKTKNNPVLAQAALKLRRSLTPELVLPGHPFDEYPSAKLESFKKIQAVIPMKNGNLLSWTYSDIKIWSFQDGTYISDSLPVEPQKTRNVFIIQNNHIVVWRDNGLLQAWKKVDGVWQSNDIYRSILRAIQLSNQQLVIITHPHKKLEIWEEDEQSLILTKRQDLGSLSGRIDLKALSETQFIAFGENKNHALVSLWEEQNGSWVSREYYKSRQIADRLFNPLDDQTLLIIERVQEYGRNIYSQHNGQRSYLPLPELFSFDRSGFLSDGRVYTFGESITYYNRAIPDSSLVLLTEAEDEWKTSVVFTNPTSMHCHYNALTLLNDGRLVVVTTLLGDEDDAPYRVFSAREKFQLKCKEVIPLERKIQVFLKEQGKWNSVLLGEVDSSVIGMTEQNNNKLITWHEDGSIQIWNLYPE